VGIAQAELPGLGSGVIVNATPVSAQRGPDQPSVLGAKRIAPWCGRLSRAAARLGGNQSGGLSPTDLGECVCPEVGGRLFAASSALNNPANWIEGVASYSPVSHRADCRRVEFMAGSVAAFAPACAFADVLRQSPVGVVLFDLSPARGLEHGPCAWVRCAWRLLREMQGAVGGQE